MKWSCNGWSRWWLAATLASRKIPAQDFVPKLFEIVALFRKHLVLDREIEPWGSAPFWTLRQEVHQGAQM